MRLTLAYALALAGALLAIHWCAPNARAKDLGQWGNSDARIRQWYAGLMQPDHPAVSCCGTADAYWADEYEAEGDHYVAIITDTRDDAPLRRPHIDPGTRIEVPNIKLKYDAGNPTGHGVIFVYSSGGYTEVTRVVLCYVVPGGT